MKILHVNISDKRGGAAIAASRLNKVLNDSGVDSNMLVCNKVSDDKSVLAPTTAIEKVLAKSANYLDRVPLRLGKVEDTMRASVSAFSNPTFSRQINAINPDIVNLHWLCDGVLRPEFIPKINAPIVWTMHDMWPFCGSENYVFASKRYVEGYNKNNRIEGSTGLDLDRWLYLRKQNAYAKVGKVVFVSPSQWLLKEARSSVLLKDHEVVCIPNGLDETMFRPIDKLVARQVLGLPKDKQIILFGAAGGTVDSRKGFELLVDALVGLKDFVSQDDLLLTIYGGGDTGRAEIPYDFHNYGRLSDDISLVLALSAADVFVIPSLVDNLPNTVLESLACGTPVVGFNIGGIPDMVVHQWNGYLAKPYIVNDLSQGLRYVLDQTRTDDSLYLNARETVLSKFTAKHQARAYMDLYQSLLKGALY